MYDVRFRWPSGKQYREKRQMPLPGKLTEPRALAWANERYRHILPAGEAKPDTGKEVRAPTLAEFEAPATRRISA